MMIDRLSIPGGIAALPLLLLATGAIAQQGPPPGFVPPPNRSTPVQSNELRETWNDRVSQGPPIGMMPESCFGSRRVDCIQANPKIAAAASWSRRRDTKPMLSWEIVWSRPANLLLMKFASCKMPAKR